MNWNIFYKYMQGQCTPEELIRFKNWLREDQANEDFFQTFVETWEEKPANFKMDIRKEWETFREKRLQREPEASETNARIDENDLVRTLSDYTKKSRGGRPVLYYAIPAVIILMISAMYFIRQPFFSTGNKAEIKYKIITTDKGERGRLELSDGTRVILNAESKLQVPSNFGESSRTVRLQGEAFLKVKKNSDLPFLVISNDTYLKVLGTEFNLNAYDSTQIKIAVNEGAVAVGKMSGMNTRPEIGTLKKTDLGILKGNKLSISTIENADLFSGWAEGKLVFKNTPLTEIAERLELWFNVSVRIDRPALGERTLTATYTSLPLSELLNVLSLSLNLTVIRDQDTIILKDKNRTSKP
jgi:ferric-dicitrate binding protein FerR (iron transport regulator)